jgi:hypothetical protein
MKRKCGPVTQEHGTGCAVACVAFILNLSYKKTLKHFEQPDHAWGRGFYCKEIVESLKKAGRLYSYSLIDSTIKSKLNVPGTIAYIGKTRQYPLGHYLVKTDHGDWMNPWINSPAIAPAKAGFQKRLPGKIQYIVFQIEIKE